jgi:RNA-directed DNA polymerase
MKLKAPLDISDLRNDIDFLLKKMSENGEDSLYRKFKIKKRNGRGYRQICAPIYELKIIQLQLFARLNAFYKVHKNHFATGFKPESNINKNATVHLEGSNLKTRAVFDGYTTSIKDRTIRMDIENAFESITCTMLHDALKMYFKISIEDIDRIVSICTYRFTLPQGAPTSPILLNIALHQFDFLCSKEIDRMYTLNLIKKGVLLVSTSYPKYTRYADDICISYCSKYAKDYWIIRTVNKIITNLGLKLKKSKTRVMSNRHGRFVTGINISNMSYPCVSRKNRHKIRAMIHRASKMSDGLEKSKLIESIKGKISYVKSIDKYQGNALLYYAAKKSLINSDSRLLFNDTAPSIKDLESLIRINRLDRQKRWIERPNLSESKKKTLT